MSTVNKPQFIGLLGLNTSKAESAANTYTGLNVELPSTAGAKRVYITNIVLDISPPSVEASQDNSVVGALMVGYQERTASAHVGVSGVIGLIRERIRADATPDPTLHTGNAPFQREGVRIRVPKTGDGKYFIYLEVCGTGNAAASTIYARVEYIVEK